MIINAATRQAALTAAEEKLAESQGRLQQMLALRDDDPGNPAIHDAAERMVAEVNDLRLRRNMLTATYVSTPADAMFYG